MKYSVAVVQSQIRHVGSPARKREVVRENIERNLAMIEYAGIRFGNTQLAVLPEWSLTGAAHTRSIEDWEKVALEIPGPEMEWLCQGARDFGIYIAGGTMEFDPTWPGRFFNTAYIINPHGEIILKYRKLNGSQQGHTNYSTPGDLLKAYLDRYGWQGIFPVVDTPLGRLGCFICYDNNFPEVVRCLALNGAEVILQPTGEPHGSHREAWEMQRRTLAYENTCYIVTADHGMYISPVGEHAFTDSPFPVFQEHTGTQEIAPMFRTGGGSEVVDFNGEVVAAIPHPGEAVIRAAINLDALRHRRADPRFNLLAQHRLDLATPVYADTPAFPTDAWLERPIQKPREGGEITAAAVERFLAQGIYHP